MTTVDRPTDRLDPHGRLPQFICGTEKQPSVLMTFSTPDRSDIWTPVMESFA